MLLNKMKHSYDGLFCSQCYEWPRAPDAGRSHFATRQVGNLTLCKRLYMGPKTETWVTLLAY